jgi:thioredoxin reductase (NADPH)
MSMNGSQHRRVVIIGSGPAGLTAAIYASRANLKPLLIEGLEAGGQLMTTTEVENYPGFIDGITGPELMERMRKQAARFGTEFMTGNITSVDFSERPFSIHTAEETVLADAVIISTGAVAKKLGVPGEKELLGRGVSTCATCDGFFFRDRNIVVAGGGDSALEEALFLSKFGSKVTVVHRRDQLRASKIMQDRAFANPKIEFLWNKRVTEIVGNGKVERVALEDAITGEPSSIGTDAIFIAIGHTPNTYLFEGQVELSGGYISTQGATTHTSVPGVFAAGDVVDFRYRQAVTAAGMGSMAAIDAERALESVPLTETNW